MLAYYFSKSKEIREFQFIFLHRRLLTNYFLARIGLKESVKYSFCNEDPESPPPLVELLKNDIFLRQTKDSTLNCI